MRICWLALLWLGCDQQVTQPDLAVPDDLSTPPDLTAVQEVMYGLAARPANPTCVAPKRPVVIPTGEYSLAPLFPNLVTGSDGTYGATSPIFLRRVRLPTAQPDPGNPGKVLPGPYVWVLALRNGRMSVISDPSIATLPAADFRAKDGDYDLTQSEGGLLSFAFDPDVGTDPARAYVYFVRANWGGVDLWRAHVDSGGTTSAPVKILSASGSSHHYGGDVQFGPDGFLYLSVGEGDTGSRARGPRNLRGKILRIDVRSTALTAYYGIPADNPYRLDGSSNPNAACNESGNDAPDAAHDCPEIFARGFRNPFRMGFDRVSGSLWVGDVGASYEEINLVELGGDYGWNDQEGTTAASGALAAVSEVPRTGCEHAGYAIIGGYVYRGSAIPSLVGKYVSGDNGAGKLFVLEDPYGPSRMLKPIFNDTCADTNFSPASFAEDENGELYVVSLQSGAGQGVQKLVPKTVEIPPDGGMGPASLLSATGCFQPGVPVTPIAGAIPYDVNVELWSDGLSKRRWMALPDGAAVTVESDGDWTLPIGTVLIKEFRSAARLLETRLLVRHDDGDWAGYTYVWNAAQSDAQLVEASSQLDPGDGGPMWTVPSRAQCLACHTTGKGRSLGLETRQMNRSTIYEGALAANQLATLAHVGILPSSFEDASAQPSFAPIADATASVESKARAYLHTNCSHCHPGPGAKPDVLFDTTLAAAHLCNESPSTAVPGGTSLLSPGDTLHSILAIRMKDLGQYRMPRLGSARVDTQALPVIEAWISGLSSCP